MRMPLPFRPALARIRRSICERVGVDRYSRPALNDLDRKLERYLDFDGGTFVEAGANDGYRQSNTYYFEKCRGWSGLLIEPVPALAAECRRNRRAAVVESALVAPGAPETLELHFADLMSTGVGALGDAAATAAHVQMGLAVQHLAGTYQLRVPARTLSAVLDAAGWTRELDLVSLDIEGGEVTALQGIDWARHAPRYLCVESRDRAGIERVLGTRYRLAEVLTDLERYQDLLYRRV